MGHPKRFHSEKTKRKLSEALTGRILSETHKNNIRKARKGTKHSEATKKKLSLGKIGENNPAKRLEVREKNRLAHLNKKVSEETKRKL